MSLQSRLLKVISNGRNLINLSASSLPKAAYQYLVPNFRRKIAKPQLNGYRYAFRRPGYFDCECLVAVPYEASGSSAGGADHEDQTILLLYNFEQKAHGQA
jgi:hypothetical protein